MRRLALTLLAALAQGCVDDYGAAPFACLSSPACPQGYLCIGHVCVREGASLDAAADRARGEARAELGSPTPEGPTPDRPRGDALPPDAPKPTVVLLQEDFGSPVCALTSDGWGIWSIDGGHLIQSSCVMDYWSTATAIGKSWLDVEVAVQVRVDAICAGSPRSYVGVVARTSAVSCELAAYYYCLVDAAGFLEVGRLGAGCKAVLSNKAPVALPPPGSWAAVALSTVGNQLSCKLTGSGAPITVALTDPSPLGAGTAGVTASNVQAHFDNFIVFAK